MTQQVDTSGEPPPAQQMKVAGWFFFICGLAGYVATAVFFRTTVDTEGLYGLTSSVNNVGLIAAKGALLQLCALGTVVGALFMVGGYIGGILEGRAGPKG